MDGVVFWANWWDGGEWMGKRKSGIWHLAVRTALWPRLVERWVGHINNKPTAELLWLADDVLHSHHPSQTGDLWREWISLLKLVAVHRKNTSFILTQWLELPFQLHLPENNEDNTLKYSWLWFYQSPWVISFFKKKQFHLWQMFLKMPSYPHKSSYRYCTSITAQQQLWLTMIIFLRDTWVSFVTLRCTHKHNKVKAVSHAHTLTYTCL